ncbi:MAG: hypothetical protein U9Q68_12170 [Euryarchaeota archaeon]|nr:hypothetical protein [Euryarchaeota archaeon]
MKNRSRLTILKTSGICGRHHDRFYQPPLALLRIYGIRSCRWVNEVAMSVGTPDKLQTVLQEFDLIPEKLIMLVLGRDWHECCEIINDLQSLLSGLGDEL